MSEKVGGFANRVNQLKKVIYDESLLMVERIQAHYELESMYDPEVSKSQFTEETLLEFCKEK